MESTRQNNPKENSLNQPKSVLTDDLLKDLFCQYESRFGEYLKSSQKRASQILNFHGGLSKQQIFHENLKKGNIIRSEIGPLLQKTIPSFSEIRSKQKKKESKRTVKTIEKPCKVLDAPNLADNFYYNIACFKPESSKLMVALESDLHLFNFENNHTENLKSLDEEEIITSVSLHQYIPLTALASDNGNVSILDSEKSTTIREILWTETNLETQNFLEIEGTRFFIFLH